MKIEVKNKFNKVYYTVTYDAINNWNYANWTGFVTADEVIHACNVGLEIIVKNSCPYLLNDNRLISGPWSGANEWIANEWMPQALNAGLRRFAHIVSPNIFSAMAASQLVMKVEHFDFEMQIFQTKEEAVTWLKKVILN
jgi:hypothetical protein